MKTAAIVLFSILSIPSIFAFTNTHNDHQEGKEESVQISSSPEGQEVKIATPIAMQGEGKVIINLDDHCYTTFWEKDYIRVQIEVKTNLSKRTTLTHLIAQERYKCKRTTYGQTAMLSFPELKKQVHINSKQLEEVIAIKITVPYGTKVEYWKKHNGEAMAVSH